MSFFHSRLLTHSESLRKNTTAIHIFGTNTFHISKKTKTNDISRTKSMYVCVMCVFCISNWTLFDFFLVIRKNLRHVFFAYSVIIIINGNNNKNIHSVETLKDGLMIMMMMMMAKMDWKKKRKTNRVHKSLEPNQWPSLLLQLPTPCIK